MSAPFKTKKDHILDACRLLTRVSIEDIRRGAPLCLSHIGVWDMGPLREPQVAIKLKKDDVIKL